MKNKQNRVFFGYDRDLNGKFVIWQEQAEIVRYIFASYAAGLSLSGIAKEPETLRVPSPTSKPVWGRQIINNILVNDKYLGDENYPRIIEDEMFAKVRERKQNSSYSKRYRGVDYENQVDPNSEELQIPTQDGGVLQGKHSL